MYIQINGLHQNNLKYSKSIDYNQLKGKTSNLNLFDSSPYDYSGNKPFYPAGAIANTYFQDLIRIKGVAINSENIAWQKEIETIGITLYKQGEIVISESWTPSTNEGTIPLNTKTNSGLPILNERFVNWIYLSKYTNFRKLWGIIEAKEAGFHTLEIESIYDWSKKGIYFTEKSWLGFKNYGLVFGMIGVGLLIIISSFILKKVRKWQSCITYIEFITISIKLFI